MDVSLILTHRCNLACGYCYAGEHHKTDIDEDVLRQAVDLLYSDGAACAQLSFFGGEPFLNFDAMKRATELAEGRAKELGTKLLLQCTSNGSVIQDEHVRFVRDHGVRVTVSIDGIREAHDRNRPCAGGAPSFDQVCGGLRRLIDGGAGCDAMMVITPETTPYAYLSCNFLWSEGVSKVRANLALDACWTDADRAELRDQLVSIGWELLARRLRGEDVSFLPFDKGMREFHEAAEPTASPTPRRKVVVATSGNLYPCAPMVGEDRDDGPEAELRLGHLDEGLVAIRAAVAAEGVACESGKGCQCAAYLETGNRTTPGQIGRWYGLVCREIGSTLAESLARQKLAPARQKPRRRKVLFGLAAIVGGAAAGAPLLSGLLAEDDAPRPCRLGDRKAVAAYQEDLPVPGQMAAPYEPPPEVTTWGEIAEPPPPPPEETYVRGATILEPAPDGYFF